MPADPDGFFDVDWHDVGQQRLDPWRPMLELARASPSWDERIAATRSGLAASVGVPVEDVEPRVAASVAHLGICARIIAPALAVGILDGQVIDSALQRMWWQPTLGGPFPLSLPRPIGGPLDLEQIIRRLRSSMIDVTMPGLAQAVRRYSVSTLIAWGNVASALHSAAGMLESAHPERSAEIRSLVAGLTAHNPLTAAGDHSAPAGTFRRNSCCLIYRVAGGRAAAICGDCVLDAGSHHTSPSRHSAVISPARSSGTATGST